MPMVSVLAWRHVGADEVDAAVAQHKKEVSVAAEPVELDDDEGNFLSLGQVDDGLELDSLVFLAALDFGKLLEDVVQVLQFLKNLKKNCQDVNHLR
jgi:hypothetical protein